VCSLKFRISNAEYRMMKAAWKPSKEWRWFDIHDSPFDIS